LPFLLAFGVSFPTLAQSRLVLQPSQDNTLYQTPIDQVGQQNELSNGAGNFLFAGRTGLDAGFRLRRALIRFDLESVLPPGAEIVAASVTLYQSRAAPGSPPAEMGLHRILQAWGEGASKGIGPEGQGNFAEPGDATWHHRIFPDDLWDSEGGSFESLASAVSTVGQTLQFYDWSCDQKLLDDLEFWLANPELNFGWILVGGELAGMSAHRFNSRENENEQQRPTLTLYYLAEDSILNDGFENALNCP
jgi:hypothetical protein